MRQCSLRSLSSLLVILAFVAQFTVSATASPSPILDRGPLASPFDDRQAFFDFMAQGPGWQRSTLERAFPAAVVERCIAGGGIRVETLRYQGHQGVVNAWAVVPDAADDVPLVIFNRGGAAHWGRLLALDRFTFCRLAAAGYAVLASDFRGDPDRPGDGKTDLGLGDAQDSIDLIDVAETLGGIDTARLALWGFSRGTMINAIMLGRLDGVKTAIMVGASADSVDSARRAEFDEHVYPLLVPDWAALERNTQDERLRAISPRHLVDAILGHPSFLFFHGGADRRTPSAPMLRYAATLVDRGYPVEVHLMNGAGHTLAERYDVMLESIITWLARTVGADTPPTMLPVAPAETRGE